MTKRKRIDESVEPMVIHAALSTPSVLSYQWNDPIEGSIM